jgi:hypothetical protein
MSTRFESHDENATCLKLVTYYRYDRTCIVVYFVEMITHGTLSIEPKPSLRSNS